MRTRKDTWAIEPNTALTKKPIVPGDAEIAANPRARSAQFRVFEKSA